MIIIICYPVQDFILYTIIIIIIIIIFTVDFSYSYLLLCIMYRNQNVQSELCIKCSTQHNEKKLKKLPRNNLLDNTTVYDNYFALKTPVGIIGIYITACKLYTTKKCIGIG